MDAPELFEITVSHPRLGGDSLVILGQGSFFDDALKDAAGLLSMPFRPKQDGSRPKMLSLSMRRKDGTFYNASREELKAKLQGLTPDAG